MIDAKKMREVAQKVADELPGKGFCLIVFQFDQPGMANYISNADRESMILGLEETVKRLKAKEDFKTPEPN